MKESIDLLGKILANILTALYEPFGFSLLLSFLAMFFYLYAYEPTVAGKGWKKAIVTWYQKFKECILSEAVPIGLCDINDFVSNITESESVAESFI